MSATAGDPLTTWGKRSTQIESSVCYSTHSDGFPPHHIGPPNGPEAPASPPVCRGFFLITSLCFTSTQQKAYTL